MSVKIKKVNIHAFRGIPVLELELEGRSLLLRGENGTGKSSIVEAIEFFFTGRVSFLEGVQGLSLQRHGPHVNFTPNDVKIEITFDPGDVSLYRTFAAMPSPSKQLEEYFQVTQKGTFILRRSQILAFITSKPADRFRAIGSILGIEPLDNVELEMMRLRDDLWGEVTSKRAGMNRLIGDLSSIIGKDVTEVSEILPVLNEMLQRANLPLIKSLEEVDKHAEQIMKSVRKAESLDKIRVLDEISETPKAPFVSEEIVNKLSELNEKVGHLLQDKIRLELSVADLLETGRRVIEQEKLDICPLCEQKIDREILLAEIGKRLNTLRGLSDKASEIRRISVPIIDDLKGILSKIEAVALKVEQFGELSNEKGKLQEISDFLESFITRAASAKDLKNDIPIQEFSRQKDKLNGIAVAISTKCGQLLASIGLTEEERKVIEVVRLIEQARSKAKDISKINLELKTYQKYYELAEIAYSSFSGIKKTKIQEIYDAIQGDIQRFYSVFHPDEPHSNIELVVALGRRASTELRIESFGRKGEDPRALKSEGHLDSLGLCIFLAFVKKFNEGCSLIVLDDVVTTVDAGHRENICKLLLEEFGDKQLIITTHDEIWYGQLCASQRAYKMEGNFERLNIVDWTVDMGPKIRPYKPRWERIQGKIAEGDKTGAGNDGRQYLEWVLKMICINTNAPVPVNNWEKGMVGDLLNHARKRIETLVIDDSYKNRVSLAFTELERTTMYGNILSHDNPLAEGLSIAEAKSFCNCVHELHGSFLCPSCGHLIEYYPNLNKLICPNVKCKDPIEVKTN